MQDILKGQHALITGGGTGIGRAIALRFAEAGAKVWILGRHVDSLRETAELIGTGCTWRRGDVADERGFREIVAAMPELHILVNNAALSFPLDALKDEVTQWRQLMEVNLWGTVHGCRLAGEKMVAQRAGGRIINISSVLGSLAEAGSIHYSMAKGGVEQLTRGLATEWAAYGILVNAIAPGYVDTPMSNAGGSNELESEWFKNLYLNSKRRRIPLARAGRPEEIAEGALFLANPQNTYMTGEVLTMDGGLSITL